MRELFFVEGAPADCTFSSESVESCVLLFSVGGEPYRVGGGLRGFLVSRLQPLRPMDSSPSVHHTPYLENRASDFDNFCTKLHLDESKKMFQADFDPPQRGWDLWFTTGNV